MKKSEDAATSSDYNKSDINRLSLKNQINTYLKTLQMYEKYL